MCSFKLVRSEVLVQGCNCKQRSSWEVEMVGFMSATGFIFLENSSVVLYLNKLPNNSHYLCQINKEQPNRDRFRERTLAMTVALRQKPFWEKDLNRPSKKLQPWQVIQVGWRGHWITPKDTPGTPQGPLEYLKDPAEGVTLLKARGMALGHGRFIQHLCHG